MNCQARLTVVTQVSTILSTTKRPSLCKKHEIVLTHFLGATPMILKIYILPRKSTYFLARGGRS